MPPLIRIKLLLNNKTEVSGIYDSGANVSLINSKLLKIKDKKINDSKSVNLRTINGEKKTNGMIKIKIKIFNIEKFMNVFIVDNKDLNYEFLIGLDCIKEFKLNQDENLIITQDKNLINNNDVNIPEFPGDIQGNKESIKEINFNENINTNNFEMSINHLNFSQQSKIEKLIEKYKSVFAKDKYDIGTVKDYEAHIDLMVDKYCYKRPYRCTIDDKKEIEEQIAKLLEKKLIEESYSPFAAPVTLAYKREDNRKSRLCIDFRDLNKIVIPQSQPFPLIEDLMVKTNNCTFFSTLDINSAFWSIPLKIEDKCKTAFVTQEGHYQWTCLPFGLKTAPAIFQRILSNIVRKHKLSGFAVNYIDDILIFSKTFEEHIMHLSQLLEAILAEGFRLKFSKCIFASNSVKYLGHIIENGFIKPLKDNLISIKNFPVPEKQKNVRQFLGKINYYNKYIPKVAIILDPLHNLLRKNQKFIWSEECEKSFNKIKLLLCSQPILRIFDPNLPIYIYTDASIQGIGAVLKQQEQNEDKKPVAYFSRKLNEAQKRKKPIYLECLAIKEAVKFWQHWLIGKKIIVYTDHKPLENLRIKSRTDEELGDLTYYLSQYDIEIRYNPGVSNQEADCLSRNPVLEADENTEEKLKIVNLISLEDIKNDQNNNKRLQEKRNNLKYENDIYYTKSKKRYKILLSEEFSKNLIKYVHNTYCHIGKTQMQSKITPFYTAKNMTNNIKILCDQCEICIKNKSRKKSRIGLLSHLGPATYPFEIVSIDTIGGFGGSRSTKKYLHLLVDHFTRYAYITTSKTQTSNDFIKLIKKITENYNIGTILADQYPGINSKELKKFLNENNISLIFTAINSPFSNGLNERLNQTIVNKIRCKINEDKGKTAWTTIAQKCTEMYNKTEHTVTKFSPEYLLNGENMDILPNELKQQQSETNLERDRKLALENTKKSHNYNKKQFDKLRKEYELNVGDLVFVENGNRLNRKKLDELQVGPYKIEKKISDTIYEINTGHKRKESNLFHITKITPMLNEKRPTVTFITPHYVLPLGGEI